MQSGIEIDAVSLIRLRHDASKLRIGLRSGSHAMSGTHASRIRGRGMEFSESRIYLPGDDVRSIDWRVTARSGKTHTKVYTEERERPLFLLCDFSSSMYFGTRVALKSVVLAQVAALLTWSGVQEGDRIGGIILGQQYMSELKPQSGRRGALAMIHSLAEATRLPAISLTAGLLPKILAHATRIIHPGSMIILVSDFLSIDDHCAHYLQRLRSHNELIACRIMDAFESETPDPGYYPITDGKQRLNLDLRSSKSRQRYRQIVDERADRLKSVLSKCDVPLISITSDRDPAEQLHSQLNVKKRHVRH